MKTRLSFGAIFFIVGVFLSLMIVGCGGNNNLVAGSPSPSPTPTILPTPSPTPSPSITSVSMSCAAPTVPVGQTNQCSSTVQGTGNFNSAVVWSVNNVQGGNSTIGFVSSAGLYTAPPSLPTPFTVSLTATSVADASKSASLPLIVAGTVASSSQTITAAGGGTITLPDGSSVTIPAGVLPDDQVVTLTETSVLSHQPPNQLVTGVGVSLEVTLTDPIPPSGPVPLARVGRLAPLTTPDITFTLSVPTSTPGLGGSVGLASLTDVNGDTTFLTTLVNAGSTPSISLSVSPSWLSHLTSAAKSFAVGLVNNFFQRFPNLLPPAVLPLSRCWDTSNTANPHWTQFSACSSQVFGKKVLVVVHGMMSCVEEMTVPDSQSALRPLPVIQGLAKYDTVVGLDYDWTQHLTDSGAQLTTFLDSLVHLGAVQIDILAHSEGVPVSLYGASKISNAALVKNFISLAGPIQGTPVANNPKLFFEILMHLHYFSSSCPAGVPLNFATFLNAPLAPAPPFQTDLQKNSPAITNVILPAVLATLGGTRFVTAGGTNPVTAAIVNLNTVDGNPFGATPNDGIVGLDSALGFPFSFPLRTNPLPPFQKLFHTDLPQNVDVVNAVATQVSVPTSPIFACLNSDPGCEALQTSTVEVSGSGYDPGAAQLHVFQQDSNGIVTAMQTPGLQFGSGSFDWVMPSCFQPVGTFSFFAFDGKFASNNFILTIDPVPGCQTAGAGTITTLAGTSVPGYSGDLGPARQAQLNGASGIAVDSAGNLFVVDTNNNVVRRIDAITGVISTIAGNGTPGFSGDGGPATGALLNHPVDLTIDPASNLYVSDAFNFRIRRIDASSGIITTIAGNGTAGFSGDGGLAVNATLNFPNGIKLDGSGNIYFGDSSNNRVRRIDAVTRIITTIAGNGAAGFAGDTGLAINAELNFPSDVRIDGSGNIYIADFQNNRIRKIDSTGTITTFAGNGSAFSSGDGGPAANAGIAGPLAISTDTSGNLYIGAVSEQHIRVVNTSAVPTTAAGITVQPGQVQTIAGTGVAGYSGDGGPAISAQINNPTGFATDGVSNLFFTDSGNNVVRRILLK